MVEFLRALESWFGHNSFISGSQYGDTSFGRNLDFNSFFYQRPLSPTEQMFHELSKWWNNLTEGQKLFIPIVAVNLLVFGAWQFPSFHPFMMKYFSSRPSIPLISFQRLLTAIATSFSHISPLHLLQNMSTLYSFIPVCVESLGTAQFLLLYLTAAVVSNLVSDMYKILINTDDSSVGASGSIMAIMAYVYTLLPNAASAIKTILFYNMAGLLMQTDNIDYASHIGGALWGVLWYFL